MHVQAAGVHSPTTTCIVLARFPAAIRLTSVLGATVTDVVPAAAFSSANHTGAFGGAQFPLNKTLSEVGALRLAANVKGALS